MTPQVRLLLDTVRPSLGYVVAPAVLGGFGSGSGYVSIQPVDPNGGAAYESALSQDRQDRARLGTELLNSGSVTVSGVARTELATGQVDSRVLLALQALIKHEPIDIVSFRHSGPHASPGIPFRLVFLAESDPAAGLSGPTYLAPLVSVLRADIDFPAWTKVGPMLYDGQNLVRIYYAGPSPLGLLGS